MRRPIAKIDKELNGQNGIISHNAYADYREQSTIKSKDRGAR